MHNIIVWLLHTQFHAHHQESSFPPSLCSAVYLAWRLLCPTKYGYTHPLWAVIWSIIFHSFTLSLCLSLELRWVSRKQDNVESWFLIHLCLLTGEFNTFIFKMIIDRWGVSTAILSFVFWLFNISIFPLYFCLLF